MVSSRRWMRGLGQWREPRQLLKLTCCCEAPEAQPRGREDQLRLGLSQPLPKSIDGRGVPALRAQVGLAGIELRILTIVGPVLAEDVTQVTCGPPQGVAVKCCYARPGSG